MAVSKRLRYEVFRRDDNTCRYCGAKAPDVEITIDHVVPVALGGSDDPSNLVTACRDCNGGKTSTSPDAPLVGDVGEDAIRWSAAMRKAADRMLTDHDARQHAYDQFEDWWGNWNYGFKKLPLPRPADWRNSIDSFTAAGLPLDVLKWCVDKAGASKAAPDQTWRYMCGIAWKKVTELQERASKLVQAAPEGEGDEPDGDDVKAEAIADWCRIILKQRDEGDVEKAARDNRDRAGDDDPSGILWFAIHNLEMDRAELCGVLRELLEALPDELGVKEMREQEARFKDHPHSRGERSVLSWAASNVAGHLNLLRARQELAAMPADTREAWMQRARDEWAEIAGHVGEEFYICEAAEFARKAGQQAETAA